MDKSTTSNKLNKRYQRKYGVIESNQKKIYLFPIVLILTILPLIMRAKVYKTPLSEFGWFNFDDTYMDVFLYYKSLFLILIASVMFLIIVVKLYRNKQLRSINSMFIALSVYVFFALLSSLASKFKLMSFLGGYEHFESFLVLLSYCLTVYYAYLFVRTEHDIKYVFKGLLISILILSLLGVLQAIGHDLFRTEIGARIMLPLSKRGTNLTFNLDKWVYLTFYNPNYVGSYVVLVLPILFVLAMQNKKVNQKIIYSIAMIGMLISTIFSRSVTGIIALTMCIFLAMLLCRKYLKKAFYIIVPLLILSIVTVFIYNWVNNGALMNTVAERMQLVKQTPNLTEIKTLEDEVAVTYQGNVLRVRFAEDDQNTIIHSFRDENDEPISSTVDQSGAFIIDDSRFPGFVITPVSYENMICFTIMIDGQEWMFTNQTDGTYYYINSIGRLVKIETPPSFGFKGYEAFATSRGYIWSRSIPLLKKHIFLGSGPDTFVTEFPQLDYVGLINYGFRAQIITKPHSLYLQMGVQTGVMSLIAFLTFYGIYFITSLKLYWKGRFQSFYSQIGVAILIGSVGYMISGLANDSSVTIAPVYWALMGIGIAVNQKVKQQYEEEAKNLLNTDNKEISKSE